MFLQMSDYEHEEMRLDIAELKNEAAEIGVTLQELLLFLICKELKSASNNQNNSNYY